MKAVPAALSDQYTDKVWNATTLFPLPMQQAIQRAVLQTAQGELKRGWSPSPWNIRVKGNAKTVSCYSFALTWTGCSGRLCAPLPPAMETSQAAQGKWHALSEPPCQPTGQDKGSSGGSSWGRSHPGGCCWQREMSWLQPLSLDY